MIQAKQFYSKKLQNPNVKEGAKKVSSSAVLHSLVYN